MKNDQSDQTLAVTQLPEGPRFDYRFRIPMGRDCVPMLMHLSQKIELCRRDKLALAVTEMEQKVLKALIAEKFAMLTGTHPFGAPSSSTKTP